MAHGKTLELARFSSQMKWRERVPWVPKSRDRSLRGKARIRARRAARR